MAVSWIPLTVGIYCNCDLVSSASDHQPKLNLPQNHRFDALGVAYDSLHHQRTFPDSKSIEFSRAKTGGYPSIYYHDFQTHTRLSGARSIREAFAILNGFYASRQDELVVSSVLCRLTIDDGADDWAMQLRGLLDTTWQGSSDRGPFNFNVRFASSRNSSYVNCDVFKDGKRTIVHASGPSFCDVVTTLRDELLPVLVSSSSSMLAKLRRRMNENAVREMIGISAVVSEHGWSATVASDILSEFVRPRCDAQELVREIVGGMMRVVEDGD